MCKLYLGKSYLKCIRAAQQPDNIMEEHFTKACSPSNLVWKDRCETDARREIQPNSPPRSLQVCPFSLRVVSVVGITYLLPQEEQPLCHPTVER